MAASGVSVMEFLIELLWVIVLYLCMFQMNRGFIIMVGCFVISGSFLQANEEVGIEEVSFLVVG